VWLRRTSVGVVQEIPWAQGGTAAAGRRLDWVTGAWLARTIAWVHWGTSRHPFARCRVLVKTPGPAEGPGDITELYVGKYGVPRVGSQVFIRTVQ
jgi:hypothetical protein